MGLPMSWVLNGTHSSWGASASSPNGHINTSCGPRTASHELSPEKARPIIDEFAPISTPSLGNACFGPGGSQ